MKFKNNMSVVKLFLFLFLQNMDAYTIGHYTVVNVHNGNGDAETALNTVGNRDVNLDSYSQILLKLANVSEQLIHNEAKLEQVIRKLDTEVKPRDCDEIQSLGYKLTGEYTIYPRPGLKGFQVRCDMDTTSGGWTIIQRRVSDSDFYKTWKEYKYGFGDINENYWLGNEAIHMVSSQAKYKLRVDLTSSENKNAYAEYDFFLVGNATSNYLLNIGNYSGNAGDSLRRHNNKTFSTKDRNNYIGGKEDCAKLYIGAWWYEQCHDSNLNGDYGNKEFAKGPVWRHWKGYYAPLKYTEMKIRPM